MLNTVAVAVLALGSLVWLILSIVQLILAIASNRWPSVSATIVAADLVEDTDSEGTSYAAKIRYRYMVAMREFQGTRICFGDVFSLNFGSVAARRLRKYRAGTTIPVRIRPGNPQVSVLEPGINAFCVASTAAAALFLWFMLHALRLQ